MKYSDKGLAEAIEKKNIKDIVSIFSSCAGIDRNNAVELIAASGDFQFIRKCYDAIESEKIRNEIVRASFVAKDIEQFKDIWGKNQDSWEVAVIEHRKRGNDDFKKMMEAYSSQGGAAKELFLSLYTKEMINYEDSKVKCDEKLGAIFDVESGEKGKCNIDAWLTKAICYGASPDEIGECKVKALVERVKMQKTSLHISPIYISADSAFSAIKDIVSKVSKSRIDSVIPNLCAIYLNEGGEPSKLLEIGEELLERGRYSLSNLVKVLALTTTKGHIPVISLG